MKRIIKIGLLCVMLLPIWAAAQNAVMNVRSRQTVSAGQTFQITFDINARPDKFNLPTVKNLTIVGGPSQGYSSFEQNINGRRTVSENYTFTILVRADKEGTANVGAASCSVDGKTVSSKPFTIKVEKADPNGSHQQQQGGWGWGQPAATAEGSTATQNQHRQQHSVCTRLHQQKQPVPRRGSYHSIQDLHTGTADAIPDRETAAQQRLLERRPE